MDLVRYLLVFILGGSLGILCGRILASGTARERSVELGQMHKVPKASTYQGLRTEADG